MITQEKASKDMKQTGKAVKRKEKKGITARASRPPVVHASVGVLTRMSLKPLMTPILGS